MCGLWVNFIFFRDVDTVKEIKLNVEFDSFVVHWIGPKTMKNKAGRTLPRTC